MLIEHGHNPQESEQQLTARVASALHVAWFLTRVDSGGQVESRSKPIDPNQKRIESAPTTDSAIDIATVDLFALSTFWQLENLRAAEAAIRLVRMFPALDLRDPRQGPFAGNAIHDPWITRNDPGFGGPLSVPFHMLSPENQKKDWVHYLIARQLMHGTPMVVQGFPGVGKAHLAQRYPGQAQHLVSEHFFYATSGNDRAPGKQFPYNYGRHILDTLGDAAVSFVSTHAPIRELLARCGLQRVIVYPCDSPGNQNAYLGHYRARGDSELQIDAAMSRWHDWIGELDEERLPYATYVRLDEGEYLHDVEIVTRALQQSL